MSSTQLFFFENIIQIKSERIDLMRNIIKYFSDYEFQERNNETHNYIIDIRVMNDGSNFTDDFYLLQETTESTIYINRLDSIFIIYTDIDIGEDFIYLARSFRNILMVILIENGYTPMHAACVEMDSRGVMIIGKKTQGKTTTLISCLKFSKSQFLSNDKCFVKAQNTGKIKCVALSVALGIRPGTIEMFGEIALYAREMNYDSSSEDRLYLKVDELISIFNCHSKNQTIINLIIVPIHNPSIKEINISEVKEVGLKEKMLTSTILENLFHHMPYFEDICDNKHFCTIITSMLNLPLIELEYNSNLINKAVSTIEIFLKKMNTNLRDH